MLRRLRLLLLLVVVVLEAIEAQLVGTESAVHGVGARRRGGGSCRRRHPRVGVQRLVVSRVGRHVVEVEGVALLIVNKKQKQQKKTKSPRKQKREERRR